MIDLVHEWLMRLERREAMFLLFLETLLSSGRNKRNRLSSNVVALLVFASAASAAQDEVTEAPRHTYRIVQHYAGNWQATLRFSDASRADTPLAVDPDRYPWPAIYEISPDDQWIFRDQKTGSGIGIAFLYHVEQTGRVWRMEQRLDDLAFAYLGAHDHISRADYYHVGAEFIGWDLPGQSLRFRVSGTAEQQGKPHLDRPLVYHLASHTVTE